MCYTATVLSSEVSKTQFILQKFSFQKGSYFQNAPLKDAIREPEWNRKKLND